MSSSKVPKGYKMKVENHPLPQSRVERLAAVEAILSTGGVQKLVFDIGKGITIHRLVKDDLADVPKELIEDDVVSSIRNNEIEEVPWLPKATPFEIIFRAFDALSDRNLRAKNFVVRSKDQLKIWLGLEDVSMPMNFFGAKIIEHKEIPEDVLILVTSNEDDPDDTSMSFKILMDQRPQRKKK